MARQPRKTARPPEDGKKRKGRGRDALASIYVLKCPETGLIRYIGQTWKLHQRTWAYGTRSNNEDARPVSCWVRSLIDKGTRPILEVIDETGNPDEREALAIKLARECGVALLNVADGGKENGHMVRSMKKERTHLKRHATAVLRAMSAELGPQHPKVVRVKDAIRRGESRFGKEEYHRRVNERHEARVAEHMNKEARHG